MRAGPRAKPQPRHALDRKLSCCLQDAPGGAFGHGVAVAGGSVPPPEGGPDDSPSNSSGAPRAICADFLNTPAGKPSRKRSFLGDSRADVVAGRRVGYRRLAGDEREKAGRVADNNGNGAHSSAGDSGSECKRAHSAENPAETEVAEKIGAYRVLTAFRNSYRVFYRVLADGPAAGRTGGIAALLNRGVHVSCEFWGLPSSV